jgi:hypothetical protein
MELELVGPDVRVDGQLGLGWSELGERRFQAR